MKIVISSNGNNINSLLDKRFGRCEFFQIHDTENGDFKVIENLGQSSSGGAGIVAAQQLIDEKVDVVITGNLGPNAFELMEKAEIKTYTCESISINDVLEKFKNRELEEITSPGLSHNGIGN